MGSVVITGNGGVAITPEGVQISLPDTDVVFKYDTATHTITLDGAHAAFGNEPILLRQGRGLKQELVLVHPDWPGFKG
ncbi:hypothetical protein SEA_GARDANN_79 [Mycobacterium phage Gardann]|uniref:Uncharacterized protein n=1 Tax=Mycobacterium phage Rumpelstiltskin TaxID=2922997 RepID=G3ME56_9CAUD|nr:hypothetical protein CL57_gp076 [Mycobacterium phage Rumpelstiltskin]YP_009292592.1 hypothetical protein BI025_gp104 [Mycobacterium phage Gardann]AEO94400.1 hypothetical protein RUMPELSTILTSKIN_76 [Mycobacterium phage Rumpelstiltskin]ANU79199.1 hypothetical protein SEA_GARDANN_79 [Mycobacterium phage Gardann]